MVFSCHPAGPSTSGSDIPAACAERSRCAIGKKSQRVSRPQHTVVRSTSHDPHKPDVFYDRGSRSDFDAGLRTAAAGVLGARTSVFRFETAPRTSRGKRYRVSDIDLASRLRSSMGQLAR